MAMLTLSTPLKVALSKVENAVNEYVAEPGGDGTISVQLSELEHQALMKQWLVNEGGDFKSTAHLQ